MKLIYFYLILIFFAFSSCGDGDSFNLFSIQDDKKLGLKMSNFIETSPEITVLDSSKYAEVYSHLYAIRNYILQSDKIKHKKDFEWRIRVIKDDSIMNAFATPGGYIFVYTGLIKYLDSEDHLAGVLGHEIAHADERHSTEMLTKRYGISFLVQLILGDDYAALREISENLLSLSFSRGAEEEADKCSVEYLCQDPSNYKADGAAGFFEKLINEKKDEGRIEFLSTHPNPPYRVENIRNMAKELNCKQSEEKHASYQKLKKLLP